MNRLDDIVLRLEQDALVLSVTGARGTGKSTLCRALAEQLQARRRVIVVASRSEDVCGLLSDVSAALATGVDSSAAPRSDAEALTSAARRIRAADRRVVLLLDSHAGPGFAAVLMKRSRDRLSIVVCADTNQDEPIADLTIDTTHAAVEWLGSQLQRPLEPAVWQQLIALVRSLGSQPTDAPTLQQLATTVDSSATRSLGAVYSLLEPWLAEDLVQLVRRGDAISPAARDALRTAALLEHLHAPGEVGPSAQELLAHDLLLQRYPGVHVLATPAARSWLRARDSIDIADDEVTDFILELLGREIAAAVQHGALRGLGPLRVFFGDGFRAHDAPVWDPPWPADTRPSVVDLRHVPPDRRAPERWLSRSDEPYLRERLFWIAGGDHAEILSLGRELGRSRHQIRRMTPVLTRPEPALAASLASEQALHDVVMLDFGQRLLRSFAAGSFYVAGATLESPSGAHAFDELLAAVLQRKTS